MGCVVGLAVLVGPLVPGGRPAGAAPQALPWPGSSPARVADAAGALGGNVSGLAPSGPDGLWAVRDAPGELLALDRSGDGWTRRPGWEGDRPLRYPDGHAGPDAEAVTTVAGDPGAVYVGAERDNSASSSRRNSVLRFSTAGVGALQATTEWRLDDLVPGTGANTGIEGLAWVPDDVLVAAGLRDLAGRAYVPSSYPAHRDGLFVVGVEQRGDLLVVALTDDGRATLVTTITTGLASVMEVHWHDETGELWALCDDNCDGTATVLRPAGTGYAVAAVLQPPSGSASLNDEGFVRLGCRDGRSAVVWSDDGATGGHTLRESALPCGAVGAVPAAAVAATTSPAAVTPGDPGPGTTATATPAGERAVPADAAPPAATSGSSAVRTLVIAGVAVVVAAAGAAVAIAAVRRRRAVRDRL